MEPKKFVIVVVLLAVVVAAIVIAVKRVGGHPEPPAWYLANKVKRIDRKTLKIFALTAQEWDRLQKGPREWKNPETGENTVTDIIICASCGEAIPYPETPAGFKVQKHSDIFALLEGYKCPKCGQQAWARGAPRAVSPLNPLRPVSPPESRKKQ